MGQLAQNTQVPRSEKQPQGLRQRTELLASGASREDFPAGIEKLQASNSSAKRASGPDSWGEWCATTLGEAGSEAQTELPRGKGLPPDKNFAQQHKRINRKKRVCAGVGRLRSESDAIHHAAQ